MCLFRIIANQQQQGRRLVGYYSTPSLLPTSLEHSQAHRAVALDLLHTMPLLTFTNKVGRNRRGKRDALSATGWLGKKLAFLSQILLLEDLGCL